MTIGDAHGPAPLSAARSTIASLVLAATASGLVAGWSRAIGPDARLAGIVAVVAVVLVGAVVRLVRAPAAVVVAAQLLALGTVAFAHAQRPGLEAGLGAVVTQLVDYAGTFGRATSFPLGAHPAAELAVCLVCGLVTLVADAAALGGRAPAVALVPLVALTVAPAHVPGALGLDAAPLALLLVGFAALCWLVGPWPRGCRDRWVAALTAAGVTAASIGASVALSPRWAPTPPPRLGPIQMTDISLSLKREIQRGANSPALTYRTDDGRPAYLRLYALPRFDADGWHLSDADVRTGAPPEPAVRDGVRRTTHVQITGFESEWLPAPYSAVATTTTDGFGYLPETSALLALGGDRSRATAGLSYDVTSMAAQPSRAALLTARGGVPAGSSSIGLPDGVPASISRLAARLTAGATTDGAKALALADYLARPEFTYSLDAAPGSGYEVLESFLLDDHRGFCVQYAGSLAVMARTVGLPSRVAVGFAPGTRKGPGWDVTMHDLHAWTELYFADYGWVAFDPTPGVGRSASTPGAQDETRQTPAAPTPTRDTAAPTSTPDDATPGPQQVAPTPADEPEAVVGAGTVAGIVALLLTAATVGAAPRWWRRRQRHHRLAPDAVRSGSAAARAAWQEVRALVVDHGHAWPPGSPRYVAAALEQEWEAEAEEMPAPLNGRAGAAAPQPWASGLRDLAVASEAALFGAASDAPAVRDWTPGIVDVEARLSERSSRGQRWRARWWPASLWRRP